jgi:hypothetical protein
MDEQKAREILGKSIQEDGSLYNLSKYLNWNKAEAVVTLDGYFTIEELEAIVWWIKQG